MKRKFKFVIFGMVVITALSVLALSYVPNDEERTEAMLKEFVGEGEPNIAQLNFFLTKMPQGGDIHHHYSGTIYAETFLDWTKERNYTINPETLNIIEDQTGISVDSLRSNSMLYRELLTLWSDKDFKNNYHLQIPPDANFFNTFGYFGIVATVEKAGLEIIKERAITENASYIETMIKSVGYKPTKDVQKTFNVLLQQYNNDSLLSQDSYVKISKLFDSLSLAIEKDTNFSNIITEFTHSLHEKHAGIDNDEFTMRYQTYASRNSSLSVVFAGLFSAFEAVESDTTGLLVGVKIVGPENGVTAINDYTMHMAMFKYLSERYDTVNKAMHAGELTLGMVRPKNLTYHIDQAINVAEADRIGHGVDLPYETNSLAVLQKMKDDSIAVEINLTSNQFILGVQGQEHPFLIYSQYGIPVVISTDDSGISRDNLTREYMMLVSRCGIDYTTLKQYVFNPKNSSNVKKVVPKKGANIYFSVS